jgi:hypothetical protein
MSDKRRVTAGILSLVITSACPYWKATPAGDTAPATWGDAPARRSERVEGAQAGMPRGRADLEERFRNLEDLRREGVIGQAEYLKRRQDALREAFE